MAGKQDWKAFNLPTEGKLAGKPRASSLAYDDVPTCDPAETLSAIRARLGHTPWNVCVAVVQDRVVQGLVHLDERTDDDCRVQDVMVADVRTFRPFVQPGALLKAMDRSQLDIALVTTSAGQLLGALRRADVAQAAQSDQ